MNTESKNTLKKSAGSLFTAGLAVCVGSGLGILYLECIRLLADSVLTKNTGRLWGIFAAFSASLLLSALLLCVRNSKTLTIKQKLIESLEQKAMDIWLGSNYRNILSDISFSVKEGEHIAITGENGSGKSTLLRCILGMYAPTSGSITLFGKSPANDAEYLRENGIFSYMPAASQLYETTVDDNILMGSFSEISLEKIKNATGVSDFSGSDISSVSQLSGGEQQRVNAARAFSNSNAKIILLDEPTASLDGEHAEKLMRYIKKLQGYCYLYDAPCGRSCVCRQGHSDVTFFQALRLSPPYTHLLMASKPAWVPVSSLRIRNRGLWGAARHAIRMTPRQPMFEDSPVILWWMEGTRQPAPCTSSYGRQSHISGPAPCHPPAVRPHTPCRLSAPLPPGILSQSSRSPRT